HVDLNRLLAPHAPIAAAALARIVDDRAFAGAGRARRHRQELPEQRLRVAPHLAAAAARAAGHRLRTGRRAGAGADRAWLETLDADRLGRAGCPLGEREAQTPLDVVAAAPVAPLPAAEQTLERTAGAGAQAEVPHEHHQRFGEVEVHRA